MQNILTYVHDDFRKDLVSSNCKENLLLSIEHEQDSSEISNGAADCHG
jgi:hypothetical protein